MAMDGFLEKLRELMGDDEDCRRAVEFFEQAYRLQMAGELDRAVELYERSIECRPTAEAYTFLGWTHSFKGDTDLAIEYCLRAIEVDPDFGNPYNDIGAYLIERGDPLSAIPWLRKAMVAKRYECYFYPHFNLGRVWEMEHRWLDALREYQKALDFHEGYTAAAKAVRRLQARVN